MSIDRKLVRPFNCLQKIEHITNSRNQKSSFNDIYRQGGLRSRTNFMPQLLNFRMITCIFVTLSVVQEIERKTNSKN